MMKSFLFLIITFLLSYKIQDQISILLNFQKDLISKGITINPKNQTVFLNSLRHGEYLQLFQY